MKKPTPVEIEEQRRLAIARIKADDSEFPDDASFEEGVFATLEWLAGSFCAPLNHGECDCDLEDEGGQGNPFERDPVSDREDD